MTRELLAGLDAGTSSIRTLLFDRGGRPVAVAAAPTHTRHPNPGWAEQDARETLRLARLTLSRALRTDAARNARVVGLGITNQRESVVAVDAESGKPLSPLLLWHDTRTEAIAREHAQGGWARRLWRSGGLPLTTYPSAPKMVWILRHSPEARAAARSGRLRFVTVDALLTHDLLGRSPTGPAWITDASNASRTLLFDLDRGRYDPSALDHFGIREEWLPEIVPSFGTDLGPVAGMGPEPLPLRSLLGDQQASLLGLTWGTPARAKMTLGTGAFLLSRGRPGYDAPRSGMICTVLWQRSGAAPEIGIEGSVGTVGSFLDWLGPIGLGLFRDVPEMERRAARARPGDESFLPALGGLFAPYWDPHQRGHLSGLSLDTRREELARAALDGVAHRVADVLEALSADGNGPPATWIVDGGLSRSRFLLQRIADLSGRTLVRSPLTEGTAWGAALAAGWGTGLASGQDIPARGRNRAGLSRIRPSLSRTASRRLRERWRGSVGLPNPPT